MGARGPLGAGWEKVGPSLDGENGGKSWLLGVGNMTKAACVLVKMSAKLQQASIGYPLTILEFVCGFFIFLVVKNTIKIYPP